MPTANCGAIVVCIGNELIADDAAGYEVYRRLGAIKARCEFCGVCDIDLLSLLRGEAQMIVVDAVQLGAPPGTVHVMPWDGLTAAGNEISPHGFGLREIVEIGNLLYPEQMPNRITLVGIEGRCFNRTREYMTEEVSAAIDNAVVKVKYLLDGGRA